MNKLAETLSDLQPHEQARLIPPHPVYVAYRGSHAHGTYVPSSNPDSIDDVDVLACYYFGLAEGAPNKGRQVQIGKWDSAAYELRHYVHLLTNCNPDVLQSLWVREEHRILVTPIAAELLRHRDLFTSKVAAKSFGGYARGQLHRMTAFHDSGEDVCCEGEHTHTPDCHTTLERGRGSQKKFATGFMGAKRKALVQQHGYDTKNAAHLIRLIRMATEFLTTGVLNVWREDADYLKRVKAGAYSLHEVQLAAEIEFGRLKSAERGSSLPERPDREKINRLLVELMCIAKDSDVILTSQWVKQGRPSVYDRT